MSDDQPGDAGTVAVDGPDGAPRDATQDGPGSLLEALGLARNLRVGLAVGVAVAATVFLVFVVLPAETVRSPWYYGALAVVLATATGGLVTVLLLARRAYQLSREL